MDCSTPRFPAHHLFPELTQTHVHRDSDAIQPWVWSPGNTEGLTCLCSRRGSFITCCSHGPRPHHPLACHFQVLPPHPQWLTYQLKVDSQREKIMIQPCIYLKPGHSLPSPPPMLTTCVCAQSLSRVRLFATLWTVACQAPLSMVFLMATQSSTLAWRIPWTEESGRLQSTGSQRVGQDCVAFNFHFYFTIIKVAERPPLLE